MDRLQDTDPSETREWVDALEAILAVEGPERAHFILESLIDKARRSGVNLPYSAATAYINTIPTHLEQPLPGDMEIENRLRNIVRWNAVAMVLISKHEDEVELRTGVVSKMIEYAATTGDETAVRQKMELHAAMRSGTRPSR